MIVSHYIQSTPHCRLTFEYPFVHTNEVDCKICLFHFTIISLENIKWNEQKMPHFDVLKLLIHNSSIVAWTTKIFSILWICYLTHIVCSHCVWISFWISNNLFGVVGYSLKAFPCLILCWWRNMNINGRIKSSRRP